MTKTSSWVTSAEMAERLGIHVQTLLKLRRNKRSPFREGTDYRWAGITTAGILQWNPGPTEQAFCRFRRIPSGGFETFAAAR
jgi:transcriptional regulator with XRE-family HTH domain